MILYGDPRFVYVDDPMSWMAQMLTVYQMMTAEERAALHVWEREHLDGCQVGTGDWPGWERYIGPHPSAFSEPKPIKRQLPESVRDAVFARDGRVCDECGATDDLSIDHRIPESKGGGDDLGNLRVLCRPCNSRKGARLAL